MLVTAGLQAAATIGTFLVALVGIWQVTPIIAYQVQQQEARTTRAVGGVTGESISDRFAADAVNWWSEQVASYERVLELTGGGAGRDRTVTFEVIPAGGSSIAAGMAPDLLVVSVLDRAGTTESVKVPVNANAMPPSQYLQRCMAPGLPPPRTCVRTCRCGNCTTRSPCTRGAAPKRCGTCWGSRTCSTPRCARAAEPLALQPQPPSGAAHGRIPAGAARVPRVALARRMACVVNGSAARFPGQPARRRNERGESAHGLPGQGSRFS